MVESIEKPPEEEDLVREERYYTDLLKSLKDDSVRPSSPLSYTIGKSDRQQSRVAINYDNDPKSPYRFMQGVKFLMWNSAGVTNRMNNTTGAENELEKQTQKDLRAQTRLQLMCEREAKNSRAFVDKKKEVRIILDQLTPSETKMDR